MKTYLVKKPFRVIGGSPRRFPGDKVRYGDKIGDYLVLHGLAEVVHEDPPKKRTKKSG